MQGADQHGGKLNDIQALRGVSILLVLIEHLSLTNNVVKGLGVTPPFYSGVDLFFVVSGFVVPMAFERARWAVMPFVVKRVFRLWPVLFVVLCMAMLANWLFDMLPATEFGRNVYQTRNGEHLFAQWAAVLFGMYPLTSLHAVYAFGPLWSLTVEFRFYLCLAALVALFNLLRAPTRHVVGILAILSFAAAMLVRLSIAARIPLGMDTPIVAWIINTRADFILAGVVLWYLHRPSRWVLRNPGLAWALALALFAAALLVLSMAGNPARPSRLMSGYGRLLLCLGSLALVHVAAHEVLDRLIPNTVRRIFGYVGDLSYTTYVLHNSLFQLFWIFTYNTMPWVFDMAHSYWIAEFLFVNLLLWPLSHFIFRRVEQPANQLGSRVSGALVVRQQPMPRVRAPQLG